MKPTEAAALLTICAAYDYRKPDVDAAKAWSLVLDGLRFDDCRDAIVSHYRTSRERIMPADVVAIVKKTRTSRLEDAAPSPPAGMDPDDTASYQRWLAYVRQAIADGREVPQELYPATRQIGELRTVLRSVPAIEAKPSEKTADWTQGMERAKAELAARPNVPVAEPIEDEPTHPPTPPPAAAVRAESETEGDAHVQ